MMNGLNRGVRHLLQRIPSDSIGVELGVWRGDSSQFFSNKTKKLHLVDTWNINSYKHLDTWENYLERNKNIMGIKGKVKENIVVAGSPHKVIRENINWKRI